MRAVARALATRQFNWIDAVVVWAAAILADDGRYFVALTVVVVGAVVSVLLERVK